MIRGSGITGYTIVEVMVFLAITAVLFLSALGAVAGRQATVQFNQGMRDAQSRLQDTINQVSSGFFPEAGDVKCDVTGNSPNPPTLTTAPGAREQGTNGDCVFLGKVVWFKQPGPSNSLDIISVAGRRLKDSLNDASNLLNARPTAIAPPNVSSTVPDVTQTLELQYGLQVNAVKIKGDTTRYGALFIYSSFPNSGVGPVVSGAQHLNFGLLTEAATTGATKDNTVQTINTLTDTVSPGRVTLVTSPEKGIIVCLSDDGKSKKGMLTIGAGGTQAVVLDVGAYDAAVCDA